MKNDERAVYLLGKYGGALYKFAFILTGTENDAAAVFSDAFADAASKKALTGSDAEDRDILFGYVYKTAAKRKTASEYDGKYGKKSDTFSDMMKLPLKERAINHLIMYEDMTEKKANEVIGQK